MFRVIDVSGWEVDERVTAPGQREKDWLVDPETRRYGLFKTPRYHPGESAAEKLASDIGVVLGISVAEVDLAIRNHEYGIISYRFLGGEESLVHGGDLLTSVNPEFDRRKARVHSFQAVREVLPPDIVPSFIEMLVFDGVIGNSDRHHDNWGLIVRSDGGQRLAPAFDHGSSLGRDIEESARLSDGEIDSYVSRGTARVGWDVGGRAKRCRHVELLQHIATEHREVVKAAVGRVAAVEIGAVATLPEGLPEVFATPSRRALIADLLRRRMELIKGMLSEG